MEPTLVSSYLTMRNHTSEINITSSFKISRHIYMGHLTYMLFNIYHSINCWTLTHIWYINIFLKCTTLCVHNYMTWSNKVKQRVNKIKKRWVGGDLMERDLCFFLSWEERNKIKKRKKTKTKFEIQINDTDKKFCVFCPWGYKE